MLIILANNIMLLAVTNRATTGQEDELIRKTPSAGPQCKLHQMTHASTLLFFFRQVIIVVIPIYYLYMYLCFQQIFIIRIFCCNTVQVIPRFQSLMRGGNTESGSGHHL